MRSGVTGLVGQLLSVADTEIPLWLGERQQQETGKSGALGQDRVRHWLEAFRRRIGQIHQPQASLDERVEVLLECPVLQNTS